MKQLLKWVIPVGALLLIGTWIGLNWNYFPANEEVFIPVVKKQNIKADTAVNSSVESDTTSTALSDENKWSSPEDSINTAIASIEKDELKTEDKDEMIEATPDPLVADIIQEEQLPVQQKKTTPQQANKSVVYPEQKAIVGNRNSNSQQPVATTNRSSNSQQPIATTKRNTNSEQTVAATNRNLTPSPMPVIKSNREIISNKQEAIPPTPKKQVVFDSYMSHKQIPVDYLVEVDGTYQPVASGKGVGEATFIVYNRSGKNLKKVNLEVQYLGKGNQLLQKLTMPVSNISADGAVSVKVPANMEADRLVYKVLYVSSALGDFYYEPLQSYASVLR